MDTRSCILYFNLVKATDCDAVLFVTVPERDDLSRLLDLPKCESFVLAQLP